MKITSRHIKAAVSIAFLVMLFAIVRKGEFVAMLKRVDPLYFVLSFVIAAAQISTSCWKWKVLVDVQGQKAGFGFLMKNYLIGYYFSNLLPSNVGGDVVRSYYAGRHIGSQTKSAIAVFIERFTGVIYMLLLVIFAPLLRPELYSHPAVWIPAIGAAVLLAGLFWIARMDQPLAMVFDALVQVTQSLRRMTGAERHPGLDRVFQRSEDIGQKVLKKTESIHEKLTAAVDYIRSDPKVLWSVILLTVLFYALTWVNVYWAFKTFGVTVPFRDIVAFLPTAMLVGSVPITLGSLGIVEGSYVFYFSLVGVAPAATLVMGLFLRFKLIVVGIVGFFNYLTYKHDKYDYAKFHEAAG